MAAALVVALAEVGPTVVALVAAEAFAAAGLVTAVSAEATLAAAASGVEGAFMTAALTIPDGVGAVLAASNTQAVTFIPEVSRVVPPLARAAAVALVLRDSLGPVHMAVSPSAVVEVLLPDLSPAPVPLPGHIQVPAHSRPRRLPAIIRLHPARLPDLAGEVGEPATRRALLPAQ